MQIQYMWINKFKNLENVGVNFSNKFRFEFNQEKKLLNKYKTKNYIEGYFPRNISAVTSLVGENGSGKTTILRLIYSFYCGEFFVTPINRHLNKTNDKDTVNEFPGFVIIGSEDSEKSYLFKGNDFEIADYSKSISEGSIQEFELSILRYPKIAFHSNFFDVNHILSQEFIADEFTQTINISTDYLLKHDYKSLTNGGGVRENYDPDTKSAKRGDFEQVLTAHKFSEYERQVDLLLNINDENFLFKIPRFLVLTPLPDLIFKDDKLVNEAKKVLDYLKTEKRTFITEVIKSVLFAAHRRDPIDEGFIKGLSDIICNSKNSLPLENFVEQINLMKDSEFDHTNQLATFLYLLKLVNIIFKGDIKTEKMLYFDFKNTYDSKNYDLKKFWGLLKSSFDYANIFSLSFRHTLQKESLLSSGELCFVNLYGRLSYLKKAIQKNLVSNNGSEKHITLLMDEIELGLHPQWQKSYFKNLMDYLDKNFSEFNIQLIFATHSPFLLSDLPEYSNNFFGVAKRHEHEFQDENINTLGQQIHTLMKDNFFIRGGIIGEYAVESISNSLDKLREVTSINKSEYDRFKTFFENISDGILRERLLRILKDKDVIEEVVR